MGGKGVWLMLLGIFLLVGCTNSDGLRFQIEELNLSLQSCHQQVDSMNDSLIEINELNSNVTGLLTICQSEAEESCSGLKANKELFECMDQLDSATEDIKKYDWLYSQCIEERDAYFAR